MRIDSVPRVVVGVGHVDVLCRVLFASAVQLGGWHVTSDVIGVTQHSVNEGGLGLGGASEPSVTVRPVGQFRQGFITLY